VRAERYAGTGKHLDQEGFLITTCPAEPLQDQAGRRIGRETLSFSATGHDRPWVAFETVGA